MSVLKCKMCGAPLIVEPNMQVVACPFCDVQQTIPNANDELKVMIFDRANDLRLQCDFDGAANVYQSLIVQFPEEAEAYWGVCLSSYGVEYVEDPRTFKKVPTCHRTHLKSILADPNYLNACKFAGAAKWKYEADAAEINRIQANIQAIVASEQPYDVFICYKETDDATGMRTGDSSTAQDIYTALVEKGYRVFYARNTLRGKAGSEYEPYIYAALSTAKVMLVLGSKPEYFNAVWVKNEWSRYLHIAESSAKAIIPCYEGMDANELPSQLKHFQALNMGNKLFFTDLMNNIERLIPKQAPGAVYAAQPAAPALSGHKELDMADGVYIGEASGSKPNGYGTFLYNNGDKFEGNWMMGKRSGQGTMIYTSGETWSGSWKNNLPDAGSGVYYDTVQDNLKRRREGTFQDGKLQGEGSIEINGIPVRKGHFLNEKLNGYGESIVSGKTCKGEFRDGWPWCAEGYFPVPRTTKCYYNGRWENGMPNGRGAVDTKTNSGASLHIVGDFVNGLNGEVESTWSTGQKFVGTIKNLQRVNGVQSYKDEHYVGDFLNDVFHGNGTFYYPNGQWTGEWKEGKRWNGNGLSYHYDENGKRMNQYYNGQIVNGVACGMGVFVASDGTRSEGEFRNDRIYNGKIYNASNQVIDTFVNGQSQAEKRQQRARTAMDILSRF